MQIIGRLVNISLAVISLLLQGHPARAQESGSDQELLQTLRGYEWHIGALRGRSFSPYEIEELMAIAGDTSLPPYLRPRALEVLSSIGTEEAWVFLLHQLDLATGVDRRRLVEALCTGFRETKSAQLIELLGPYLEENDAHLRLITMRCLSIGGNPVAHSLVNAYKAWLTTGGEPWEREALGIPGTPRN